MNKCSVPIMISARHVHLTKETYYKLFDKELTIRNELNQVGQFAANETVTIENENYSFENVRIVGPFRSYDQVEISASDARLLKINPPVRTSGDLNGAISITIKTLKDEVTLPCTIISDRHVHMNQDKASELGVVDGETLKLEIFGEKSGVVDIHAKVSDDGFFEVHLDTDDANAFLLSSGDVGTLHF